MIGNLARRMGLRTTVSAGVVADWRVPELSTATPFHVAPLGGAATCLIDAAGRVQSVGRTWSVELAIMAGANWRASWEFGKIVQRVGPVGTVTSTVRTPDGPIHQHVAAGVVAGSPVAIVEIENQSGIAVAVGAVVRPFTVEGRGYANTVAVSGDGMTVDGHGGVRFVSAPASVAAAVGSDGDLLAHMPAADGSAKPVSASCRSGAAQGAAVWPLPHTSRLRFVVELDGPTARTSAVPSIEEVERGWQVHLSRGSKLEVDGEPVASGSTNAARSLLTSWPTPNEIPAVVTALAEADLGDEAPRLFDELEQTGDQVAVLAAMARWFQLGASLDELDQALPVVARAAHEARRPSSIDGAPWLAEALQGLAAGLQAIEQPDVAERVAGLSVVTAADDVDLVNEFAALRDLTTDHNKAPQPLGDSARLLLIARMLVVDDRGDEVRAMPWVPDSWRGKPVDVLGVPTANGRLSFGLRWHGPRAAFLWEFEAAADAPLRLTVPGIDPSFSTSELTGETLLADPGWDTA